MWTTTLAQYDRKNKASLYVLDQTCVKRGSFSTLCITVPLQFSEKFGEQMLADLEFIHFFYYILYFIYLSFTLTFFLFNRYVLRDEEFSPAYSESCNDAAFRFVILLYVLLLCCLLLLSLLLWRTAWRQGLGWRLNASMVKRTRGREASVLAVALVAKAETRTKRHRHERSLARPAADWPLPWPLRPLIPHWCLLMRACCLRDADSLAARPPRGRWSQWDQLCRGRTQQDGCAVHQRSHQPVVLLILMALRDKSKQLA